MRGCIPGLLRFCVMGSSSLQPGGSGLLTLLAREKQPSSACAVDAEFRQPVPGVGHMRNAAVPGNNKSQTALQN